MRNAPRLVVFTTTIVPACSRYGSGAVRGPHNISTRGYCVWFACVVVVVVRSLAVWMVGVWQVAKGGFHFLVSNSSCAWLGLHGWVFLSRCDIDNGKLFVSCPPLVHWFD